MGRKESNKQTKDAAKFRLPPYPIVEWGVFLWCGSCWRHLLFSSTCSMVIREPVGEFNQSDRSTALKHDQGLLLW